MLFECTIRVNDCDVPDAKYKVEADNAELAELATLELFEDHPDWCWHDSPEVEIVEVDRVDELVDRKNALVKELNSILIELLVEEVDLLCDSQLREAVVHHPALELK